MPNSLDWTESAFDDLTPRVLYAILALRQEVFALEQQCLYQDLDELDFAARHLLGHRDGVLVAYARWFRSPDGLHLGRIVTKATARGRGFGRALVAEALRRLPAVDVLIDAQAYLERFYAGFGFERHGENFPLDGIPHLRMVRPAR